MASLTFQALLKQITGNRYGNKESIMSKLDIFLAGGRISVDEYNQLVELVDTMEANKQPVK